MQVSRRSQTALLAQSVKCDGLQTWTKTEVKRQPRRVSRTQLEYGNLSSIALRNGSSKLDSSSLTASHSVLPAVFLLDIWGKGRINQSIENQLKFATVL